MLSEARVARAESKHANAPAHFRRRALRPLALLALIAMGSACKRKPEDLREWRASDHSHEPGEGPGNSAANGAPQEPEDNDPMIAAEAIWGAQCATCHGESGHGDGPQAALTHPRDLTDPTMAQWTDAQLRDVIVRGRGMMPAFGQTVRPEGIDALVRFVRTFRR